MSITTLNTRRVEPIQGVDEGPGRGILSPLTLAFLFTLVSANTLLSADAVLLESKTLAAGSTNQTVGIYIENQTRLTSVVLPLDIRSLSGGAYIANNLQFSVLCGGRCEDINTVSEHGTTRYFPQRDSALQWAGGSCGDDSADMVWRESAAQVDFNSPDAILYSFVGQDENSYIEPDSDGEPGSGTPSFVLTFDVGPYVGQFEIDSTCVCPANHVAFVDPHEFWNATLITPEFTKSIITVVPAEISGHITTNHTIAYAANLVGDITVDSGVTLTVSPGATIRATGYSDALHSGLDTGLVEIIVKGKLDISGAGSSRPYWGSDTSAAGSWFGIRVMPGGQIHSSIGAIIEHAVTGITIESGAIADSIKGLRIQNCSLTGIRSASSAVVIDADTVLSINPGYGIFIDHADPPIRRCFLDSCEYGIYTFLSSSRITENRVDGPGVYGIFIANGAVYEDIDSLRLVRDTVTGYFSGAHLSANAINWCLVDSCGFISHPSGQRSPYGIKAGFGSSVRLRRSTIQDFTTRGFDSFKSGADLGKTKVENNNVFDDGENDIVSDSTTCTPCHPLRVVQVSTSADTLHAHANWWGADPPLTTWFSGKVHYTGSLAAPSTAKMVAPPTNSAQVLPKEFALGQNYPNPFNPSTTIEFALPTLQDVHIEVYNVLGQSVRLLVDQQMQPGRHLVAWDGTNESGTPLASGVYLYRLTAGTFTDTRKMMLLK